MTTYETLLADATRLAIADRIQLIEDLWDTLPRDALLPMSDEWIAEIQRRSAEYDSGSAEPLVVPTEDCTDEQFTYWIKRQLELTDGFRWKNWVEFVLSCQDSRIEALLRPCGTTSLILGRRLSEIEPNIGPRGTREICQEMLELSVALGHVTIQLPVLFVSLLSLSPEGAGFLFNVPAPRWQEYLQGMNTQLREGGRSL